MWNAVAMPVTLLLIASHLSPIEQGFYYSFAGVQGLAVLGELGITFVIGQFAAHEYAGMRSETNSDAEENRKHAARLASVLKLGLIWNIATCLLCLTLLIPGGIYFFMSSKDNGAAEWALPWICFAIFSSLGMILAPVYAVLNGTGHIGDTSLIQFIQNTTGTLVTWGLLLFGFKLLAAVALPMVAFLGGSAGILIMHRKTLQTILTGANEQIKVNYLGELFPLQSKVAFSWIAGYVGFYLSTPLIFHTMSPQVAGQFGMTSNLLQSVSGTAAIWVNTKAPVLAGLAARQDIHKLRRTFLSASTRSFLVLFAGYLAVIIVADTVILKSYFAFLSRLLSGENLIILIVGYILAHTYGLLNVYLRAFKDDPLFWVSIASALISALALQPTVLRFGVEGVAWLMVANNTICCLIAMRYFTSVKVEKAS